MTVMLLENGDVLRFDENGATLAGKVPAGRVLIDASGSGEVVDEVLRDRRHLSEDGLLVPVVAINKQTGEVEGDPEMDEDVDAGPRREVLAGPVPQGLEKRQRLLHPPAIREKL